MVFITLSITPCYDGITNSVSLAPGKRQIHDHLPYTKGCKKQQGYFSYRILPGDWIPQTVVRNASKFLFSFKVGFSMCIHSSSFCKRDECGTLDYYFFEAYSSS